MFYGEKICGEEYNSLKDGFEEAKRNGANPQLEPISFEDYVRPISKVQLKNNTFKEYNGNHFIYGWFELLIQSDYCPPWIYANKEPIYIEVKNNDI